jgi:flagellar basal body-associated protein FliL
MLPEKKTCPNEKPKVYLDRKLIILLMLIIVVVVVVVVVHVF